MSEPWPPPGTPVGIYKRYSTQNQGYESILRQAASCHALARANGWVVVGEWEDLERSGTTLVGRDGFFSMMAAADKGKFKVLVVEDLSRLSRTSGHTHSLVDELTELEISICTASNGRMVEDVDVMVGAYKNAKDVTEAAYRSRGGQVRVIESGRSAGKVPFGYLKVHRPDGQAGHRAVDQDQKPVARRLFEETLAGLSPNQICAALNREGHPGPSGKGWRPGALVGSKGIGGGILRNPIYIGKINWGRTERKRRKGKIVYKPAPESKRSVAYDSDLAIIEPELFEQVQQILNSKKGSFYSQKKPNYPFSSKFRCGLCGETMIVLSGKLACTGRNVKGTTCANRIRVSRKDAERAVLDGLSTHLLQEAFIEPCVAAYRTEAERAEADFAGQMLTDKAKLEQIENQIAGLMPLINDPATPIFAKQALLGQLNAFEADRQQLAAQVNRALPGPRASLAPEKIVERLKDLLADISTAVEGEERDAIMARDTLR